MRKARVPLTKEQKREKRLVDLFLVALSLLLTATVIAEVWLLVPFFVWFQDVRGF